VPWGGNGGPSPYPLSLGFVSLSLSLMGINLVQPSSVKDVVTAWRRRMKSRWVSVGWKIIPLAMVVDLEGKEESLNF